MLCVKLAAVVGIMPLSAEKPIMAFNDWAKLMGLNDKSIQILEQEDLNDYDTLGDVSEKDLCELRLTIGMRALLLRAVERCKCGEGVVDVTDDVDDGRLGLFVCG